MRTVLSSLFMLLAVNFSILAQSITLTPDGTAEHRGEHPDIFLRAFNIPSLTGIRSIGSNEAPSALFKDFTMLRLNGRGYDGNSFSGDAARIRFVTTENWNSTSHGAALTFVTTQNGSTSLLERMRIGHNGRIGIGITEPLFKLHLKDGNFGVEDALPYIYLKTTGVPGSGNAGILFANSANQGQALIRYDHSQDLLRIVNGSSTSDGINITKNGNLDNLIGVGTSAPTGKVHISSNSTIPEPQIVIEESSSMDYGRISFNNTNATTYWTLAGRADNNIANMNFNLYNSETGNVAIFSGNGNAQIAGYTQLGSSAPKVKLVKLTGTTDNVSYLNIDHGSSLSKILGVQIFIYANEYYKVPPGNASNPVLSKSYDVEVFSSYIHLSSLPGLLQEKPYEVLLTIEE